MSGPGMVRTNSNRDKSTRFLRVFVLSVFVFAALLVSINYFTDRYYIFHPQEGVFQEFLEPNTRVLKARYLEQHCSEFDAIIMGSSRDAGYRSTDIDTAFGVNSYNYAVAAGNLRGVLAKLEWLASMNCMPGRIFLPISPDRLRLPARPDDLLRKEYPDIVGNIKYRREFIMSYIGADAFISNLRKLIKSAGTEPEAKFSYDMSKGDAFYLWNRTFPILECVSEANVADQETVEIFAAHLSRIKTLAVENDVEITLILNPQPIGDQLAHAEVAGALFQLLSGEFHQIYRLPLSDERLRDSDFYHDRGHFKHELGAAVIGVPENEVSLSQLTEELDQAARVCIR
jgi:hypothetical protein